MAFWSKLTGTSVGKFILGFTGVTLKNNSGVLDVKNTADTAYASAKMEAVTLFNNTAGFGNKIQTDPTQAADFTYTLPLDDGTPAQVLATDGSGVLSWVSAGSTSQCLTADTTSFAFGSASTIVAFTLPINAIVDRTTIIIDTAFDGTPTLSVGTNGGSASEWAGSGDSLLTVGDRYDVPSQVVASGSTKGIELYYSAGGASVGAGRVIVYYCIPS